MFSVSRPTNPCIVRGLSAAEKSALAPYIPHVDLERAILHCGRVPWYLPKRFCAIARGKRIYFRRGAYDPESSAGIALLGHELAHVGQYRAGMTALHYLCSTWRGYRKSRYEQAASAVQARILQDLVRRELSDT